MILPNSIRSILAITIFGLGVTFTSTVRGQVLFSTNFDNAANYDQNFVKLAPSGTANIAWNASGYLTKSGTGSESIIFDTSATGGSGGSGGSSGSHINNNYSDVTLSSEFQISAFNGPSMGFWARGNDANTSAYLGLITMLSSTSVRLRIYDSNSNPTSTAVGTLLADQTITVASLSTGTYYTGLFTATNDGTSAVNFSLSLYDSTGTTEIASTTGTDTTTISLMGQVGIRGSSNTLQINDFSVVPESSQMNLLLIGIAALGYKLHRRAAVHI